MNREILFRAKRKDKGEWIEGGYVKFDYNGNRYIYYNCFVESIADID